VRLPFACERSRNDTSFSLAVPRRRADSLPSLRARVSQLAPTLTAGSTVTLSAQFDGWGYVHLFNANTLEEIDTYAVAEALDPAFASGFGTLSVHEVATDIESDLAYLSYYDAGLRVIRFGPSGIQEVGHYIDANGNDFWGVQVFRVPADPTERTYVAASDRDSGLWIFKYTGP
jgi:hypothetical protein